MWLAPKRNMRRDQRRILKMLAKSSQSIDRLKKFALQLADSTNLPPECHVKKVCSRVLSERHKTVSAPLSKAWVETYVLQTGVINWKQGG